MSGRLVFAGTPDFAVPCLQALIDSAHEVVGVLTQPDRPAGRGRAVQASPVKQLALARGLPVQQPVTLKDSAAVAALAALQPDLLVVVAYGLLLPGTVLALPPRGCVNVHASLLPRWRGAAPVQAAILAGDPRTGVCLMAMDEGLDTGPVYACAELPLTGRETAGQLHDSLATAGAGLLATHLDALVAGQLAARPQPAAGATYAGRIAKAAARLDWSAPAQQLDRQVRAYNPWPVAETTLAGRQLRVWAAEPAAGVDPAGRPGEIFAVDARGLLVATGQGSLRLLRVQAPGRAAVAAADFARGREVLGQRLGA